MVRILTDADVRRVLDMRVAIDAVNDALRERAAGTARSLPRQGIEVGEGSLVLTAGGFEGLRSAGLRVYAAGYEADEQLVAVWDAASGRLQTIIVGNLLGAVRTGAIGGARSSFSRARFQHNGADRSGAARSHAARRGARGASIEGGPHLSQDGGALSGPGEGMDGGARREGHCERRPPRKPSPTPTSWFWPPVQRSRCSERRG